VEHPKVLPTPIILKVTKEMGQHILDNKIIITIGQLLKLALDLSIYLMILASNLPTMRIVLPRP
jgi:hypothetical protein